MGLKCIEGGDMLQDLIPADTIYQYAVAPPYLLTGRRPGPLFVAGSLPGGIGPICVICYIFAAREGASKPVSDPPRSADDSTIGARKTVRNHLVFRRLRGIGDGADSGAADGSGRVRRGVMSMTNIYQMTSIDDL